MSMLASVHRRGAVIALVVGLIGCRGVDASRQAGNSATPSPATGFPIPPPLPGDNDPAPASPAPLPEALPLPERLAREAASRPTGAVRSEQLVAALEAKGVAVGRTRQVLGRTLNARFCAIAVTGDGLVASVCEFDSPSAAIAAQKDSEQRFGRPMPNRRFMTNGQSLLTIANLRDSVEPQAQIVAATFAALRAS
jgi:hypothetical protein